MQAVMTARVVMAVNLNATAVNNAKLDARCVNHARRVNPVRTVKQDAKCRVKQAVKLIAK